MPGKGKPDRHTTTAPLVRILVCGSRGWTDDRAIRRRLQQLPSSAVIVHGGAPGADRLAEEAAQELGLVVEAHPADWRQYGRSAGIIRNLEMLDSHVDLVLAFWDQESSGTQHTTSEAVARGIPVEVYVGENDG